MILKLFTGYSIWEYFTCIFDNIPKTIYFLLTAILSALDALQCLLRRLVGLDVYWQNGEVVANKDPLLGFIEGILGIGNNASAYTPLRTVFWSMAIFGLIVLAISTMIAIIKSHYQEDSAKTSPVGYLYTALKSVLTFAIVPVSVIVGFWLSHFMLKTLDDITAGRATEERLQGIYGAEAVTHLVPAQTRGGVTTYTYYDYFGGGAGATSQTFSGMIFTAAAYNANRVRNKWVGEGEFADFGIFGKTEIVQLNGQSREDAFADTVGRQIDYAFANNLNPVGAVHPYQCYYQTQTLAGKLLTIPAVDMYQFLGVSNGFSKWNVGLVWIYYNLWQYNFMIGFGAVVTCFGLLASIIFGVMSRLIKSVALFLIYPATLGLAPLDDFKAFKSWRSEFVSQALMAFGAIIGMNLFFLVFPYLSEIEFFDFGLLNYMVYTVMIIVGLSTIKQFISFLSGLIGGADAVSTGEQAKEGVKKTLTSAGKLAMGAASLALNATPAGAAVKMGLRYAGTAIASKKAGKAAANAARAGADLANDAETYFGAGSTESAAARTARRGAESLLDHARINYAGSSAERAARFSDINAEADRLFGRVPSTPSEMAAKQRYITEQQNKAMFNDSDWMNSRSRTYRNQLENAARVSDRRGFSEEQWAEFMEHSQNAQNEQALTARATQIRESNYMDASGGAVPDADKQMLKHQAQNALGSIQKMFFKNLPENLGIKTDAISGIFRELSVNEFNDKGEIVGRAGGEHKTYHNQAERTAAAGERASRRQLMGAGILGAVFGYGDAKPSTKSDPADKATAKATEKMTNQNQAILKVLEKIERKLP